MTRYAGVYVQDGIVRNVEFEASSFEEAKSIAQRWGVGISGDAQLACNTAVLPPPEAYDEESASKMLGGVSRSSLYRMVAVGKLDRLPGTRRFLITRESIERYSRS